MADNSPLVNGQNVTPEAIAAELERLAEATGHDGYRRAARALFQERPGRKPLNDSDALSEAEALLREGAARDVHEAIRIVARTMGSRDKVRAISQRLGRKYARQQKVAAK